MAMPENMRIGLRGEQLTARYLRDRGFTLYGSDFATFSGETDIIALSKDGTLCFVEVKTRSPGGALPPSAAVDKEKEKRLIRNAAYFLKYADFEYKRVRFDIAEVLLSDLFHAEINIIEDAFGHGAFPDKE